MPLESEKHDNIALIFSEKLDCDLAEDTHYMKDIAKVYERNMNKSDFTLGFPQFLDD